MGKVHIGTIYSSCNIMTIAEVYYIKRVKIIRSGCLSCAVCPEQRFGVCNWAVWKWSSVQDQFCLVKPFPSAFLFFLDSLPAFPLRAIAVDENFSVLHFISLFWGPNIIYLVGICFSSILWLVFALHMLLLCFLLSFPVPCFPNFVLQPLCLLSFFPKV